MSPTDTEIREGSMIPGTSDVPRNNAEVSVEGSIHKVPSIQIDGRTVIVSGRWMKLASVHDEDWQEGTVVASGLLDQIQTGVAA